ncbi:MAG: hypothetical protein GF401_09135 [Chitinivibrionales bacterium]|nr:hypothetical protein [Chitinivibrionales bacterium]
MHAVVFHEISDIRLDDVPEPEIQEPTDAIVKITASAIFLSDILPTGYFGADCVEIAPGNTVKVAPNRHPENGQWQPGNAPSPALDWEVEALDKAGTLAIIGVYPQQVHRFPIGIAMNKNLTINMGNCNHRRYIPELLELVVNGSVDPSGIVTEIVSLDEAVEAYRVFDIRKSDWIKVELVS